MVGAGAADGSVGATGSGEAAKEKTSSVGAAAVGPSSSGIVAAIGSGSGNSFSIFFSVNIPRQSRGLYGVSRSKRLVRSLLRPTSFLGLAHTNDCA
jgi:hypothetical protein